MDFPGILLESRAEVDANAATCLRSMMRIEYAGVQGAGEESNRHKKGFPAIPVGISCGSWKLQLDVLEARQEDPQHTETPQHLHICICRHSAFSPSWDLSRSRGQGLRYLGILIW